MLLEPYPFLNYSDISHDYIIKYRYSLVCAKPDPVFRPETNVLAESYLKNMNADSESENRNKETEALKEQLEEKTRRIEELGLDLENKNRALSYYENGKPYRLAKSLYKTFRRG